jgi:hypothetical protein
MKTNMTNEQNIIAVPVPVDAHSITTYGLMLRYFMGKTMCDEQLPLSREVYSFLGCVSFKDGEYIFDFGLKLGIFNFEDFFIYHLQSMGHYWVNPLGEKFVKPTGNVKWIDDLNAWRAAESKRLRPDQKLAIIKIGG